jgi:hypothetical protein
MDTPDKPRTLNFSRLLNRNRAAPSSPQTSPALNIPQPTVNIEADLSDRKETKERFLKAASLLRQSLKGWQDDDGVPMDFPELAGEPETFDSQFREKLNMVLDGRKESIKDKSSWSKCAETVEGIFTALSPFAKTFLIIAKEGSSVKPLRLSLKSLDTGS